MVTELVTRIWQQTNIYIMAERPLYTLYKNLKAQNYDVPDDYNKFESALTRDGKGGADNRHAIYENLKAQNFDVPSTYERFYSALFEPRSRTSSRAKGGSVPMSAADRARFSAGAAAISASAQQTMNNAGRYNRLKQRKQKQQKAFGRVNLGTHQTSYGGDANNVVKDDFAYNPETGKAGEYVTSDNENVYSLPEAEQMQAILDKQNDAYQVAVDTGEIPSAFDVRDKNGNYDLQENIGKNGTYLTEEGAQKQFDKKLADAYARKKEIEALIAEDNRQHGNPLLSYGASIGASNGRTAEQSDYRNKLATSLSLVTEQIGALEAVKQYPTSSWGEDALKALDNTAFTAKTWDFGLTDFAIMGQMERIKTKMDNNIPLSGSDKMLLKSKLGADAATALEDEKMGNVYRWTKIAGQSLPFMADFFLTGGYGGITKGISRGALKFAAKRGMGKVSAAILKNTGIVAGDVIGSYAMAGTEQALKTGADIMQRHLGNLYQDEKGDYKFGTFDENGNLLHEGGESMGTALYKGMTSAMVENYTEKLFGHNYGIKKGAVNFMEKHGMNASAEFFKNIGKSGWYTNSKKWMEKFGINGFGEEVMEEEIGIPLHALLDGEGKVSDLLDARQQLDIIGGMAISVGSMYAMGAGSRPVKGIYNRAQYYRFRNKVNVADSDAQNLMGDNWADIKDKIDNATNEQMGSVLADILRKRDTMTKEQINAAVNYGVNLMKMRGYNIAKTAEMNAREITNEPTTPEEQHQADIDNAYSEGHDADDADKHDIQIQQEDQMKTLAAALGISEQQLSAMSDEKLESLTGQDDKLDQAIYDYQLSSARYQGVVDDAQDKVDLAAHQAEQRVDMYTDQSRGSVRNATIKASGGLEDYGVYIISGNIATHDDGSIDVSNSDGMILYYDPTTNSVEHADALMFAELGEELPADDVKAQTVADAKENAIKEVAGIIDGTVEVGSQFNVTDSDGTEHTYEVLADYGDGTAAISIDGNVVENPYSLADLQQMKDLEDQKRLETAKAEREQMEKERAAQQNQETEETQPSFDFNQILNDNGNVVLVDVLDKDGNTKYPDSRLFLIRDAGAKAKVVELKSDGTLVPHAVNKEDVATISSMSLDEYKQAMPESSMIEDNSGEESDEDSQLANLGFPKGSEIWMSGDGFGRPKESTLSRVVGIDEQGSIVLEDKDGKKWSASFDYINNHRELPPLDENTNIVNEENNQSESNAEENTPAPEQTPAMTLEDGTIVPMLEDGNPDFSKLTAAQTAELYDTQFGEDADSIVSGYVSDAKKALDKASNMTVKGKTFVEQKAAKDAKEKAIADAQAAYDSAIAIRDAYNERQLAKVEDTAEGRKELIEKARRKFARLKSAVKDDAEAVSQLYRDTIGSLLHRLYDGTGIDVTDTIPLTAEEYVASNLGAHSLNYEGTETSKGVKQETGLSREDFAKTQLLAADGKGTTIDALVHSLWENRPSNLESLDTQDIRNALIGVLNSGFKASEARNFVENIRIAQAENILEEQKRAQENAAYAEQHKAEPEAELKAKSDEKAELKAKSEAKLDNESSNESNDLSNESDNEKTNDKINDNINVPEDATDEAPLGAQRDESDLPFSAKENGKQQTTAERAADVEKNKVDDIKVVDNIVGEKTRKAFERLAKMMGANIQWQYSDKLGNGWIQETTDADGNVHRTIFITLDSSIKEGAQFIFGHEMTHQIKNLNPAAYNELTQLVLDTYGSDAFDKAVDETMQRYSDAGFSGRARDYYAEEVVADSVGEMIRDLNLAHTLAMKMSHPLLAAIHEILQKIKLAFFGTEYSDVTKNIIRSIEQAYVKTANGQVTNSETGEDVSFSLRQKPEPKKKGVGYKVFVLKDGKLYPPMVANPDGAATPVGVWLDADAAPIAGESKTGRPQVKQGGKGTQGGSGKLAYRPGWHLGVVPYAIQFNRKDAEGNKTLFPKNFVFAEVEYAADVDYQEEARQEGINSSGKYQHSLAGLKHLPTNGYYMYRTNPNPETDPWVITGAMKVNRILTRAEQAELVKNAGREPQQIQEGDIVTDDVVNSINQEIADAPKFSLKVYHGSGAMQITEHTKFSLRLKSAIEETETNPSYAQKESGNYKKGHIKFGGYDYTIENPKGSTRSGKDADGKEWKVTMHDTYGYIRGKFGKDGDHLDMFINDKADLDNWNGDVFVVDQVNPDGSFDEHKVMYGYDSMDDAKKAYLANYSDGWQGLGNITGASKDEFDKWLDTSNRKLKPFADYAKVKFSLKDEEYLKAVEDGNMEKAQKMVNEAADAAGYSTDSSYQGTSAFNGAAPWGNGYFLTKDERKEAWDNGEFEGESTLGDYINDDIDGGNLEELTNAASYRAADPMRKDAIDNVRNAIHKKANTITMYRSVPSDVKEGSFRNGDWVTPSRAYAVDNAKLHGWGDDYNIIEQKVPVDDVWFDGNDIAEWGYGREEDYINDTDFAYKNSKNNKKLLDAVTYDDNGNVIPLSQRFNEKNKDVRFSLKDEKTLAGVHNISEEKLLKAIKQGGLANPSVAVIDSSRQDHKAYGGISLILPSDKIAKRTGKNAGTWQGDAYTPTYPQVERHISDKGSEQVNKDVLSVPKEMQHEVRNGIYRWLDGDANSGLKYLFLHEKGVAPEQKKIQPKFSDEAYNELKFITAGDFNIYGIGKADAQKVLDMYIEAKFDGDKDLYEEKTKAWLERNKSIVDAGAKGGMRYAIAKENVELYDEYGFNYKGVQTFVRDVEYDHRKSGVDTNATLNEVEDYIKTNNLTDEFNTWLEGKEKEYGIKEVIFDGFTPSGNRRYVPNTLENVSKLMKKQGRNGATGAAVSFQNFAARLMPSYGTLKDIRSKKGLLTSDREKFDKFREKWSNVFFELGMKCQPDATGTFDDYGLARLSEAAMTSDPQAYLKKEYNVDFSDEDTKRLKEMVKAIKEEHPAMYFETKFERPVRFDEFSAAVVPTTTKKEVKEALKNAGVSIFEYDEKNDADRSRAFNEAINSSDNIRFSLKSMMEKPEGWKQANKKAIHIAEVIERDPKFSLKNLDGTLIKAGTYFSGGGLVEEGLKGIIDPVVAVEYDEKISGVYRNNFGQHIVTADVRDVDPKELVKQIDGEVEYFHASPVCKNYSQAKSNHAEVELDKETAVSTAEFINAIKPKVVTIENVKGYKDSEAMKTITDALDANGYTWDADVYNAADYGGYTNRERLIVRAVRDGKLPEKPKKMARKSGWYEAVADIIPTLTEKKNGVAPWMDIRLKADGIDWRNIDKPLYVMGSAYADGKVPHAFADELLPTLRTKSGDVIVMPDGKVYRAMGRVLARVSGVSDDYKMPFSENLSHTIIGNGIPTQLTEHVIAPLLQNTLRPTTPEDGNIKFSLRYDQFEHDLNQWKKDNNLPKDAQRPTIPQRNAGESAVDFLRRVDEYRKQMALWKTAPTYEQHLLSDDTALGEFNRELQRGSVLKRIAFQDSMLAIRKAQEAIMKEVGVDRLNMAEDAYTAENRSHGKGKNEFEEYNNEFLQPLRKAYHQMKKILGDSYDNVRIYMMAKHGLERDAQMAFKKSLEADYEDVAQRSAAYKAYKGDMNRIINDSDLEFGRVDFTTWRQRDNALRVKYSPSYMDYRYDKNGIVYDYSGLSALFDGSDFEEAAHKLVKDIESKYVAETHNLWDATNAATKKILRDGYKAGMMSKDTYQYVRDMYSHYIPLRGWDGTTADQVWDYIGGGKGAFNQTLKTAHGRTSIADDPIAYIENMAESGILLNNKNWVKQHLMLLAQNHPTSLLTLSKAWYVKSVDANGNEEWIPATPQITSQMNSNQVKAAIDAFEQKMENMAQTGDATQKRDGLNIAYPQTHSEEREHEVRVMKDGEEYVIYVNGDPQLAQAMNNTRAHRVREIQSGKLDRAAAWLGRKMAAAYTSLSPLFIPSNYFRDLTMTLASTAIREDAKYNYLLRKNLATSWNLGFMLRDYQNGKLRDKVNNGNATPKEQMFYDFMMNGGETGFVSSLDVEDLKKKFKNDLKDLDRWKANPVKVGHTIMDSIEFLNRMIEDSNRFAVYMTSIQYGRSIDEAVNDAKDVTLNFNRKGTGEYGWQMIRNLYLFINPAVQSLQTLGALAKHHPFKFTAVTASWLTSGVLVPIVNAALMSLLGGDDDKDKYWQFTKWDRRNNLIMWVPFTHEYIKIPLAQEFRAFYGIGDMIASKMMGGELAEESWSQYGEDLLGQVVDMLPLDPTGYDGNVAVSLMPNAIRPVFELAFNVDFTGKPLFKETEYNKYDPNFTKAYVGTPDWLVRASKMVNSIGNDYPDVQQNSIDAFGDPRYNLNNPAVVDHVLSSYLGGAYTMGSQVLGVLTKSLNDPKEIKVADIPLFSKFVSNPDDRPVTKKQGDEFWDMKENHDRAANTLSKLKKQANVDGDYSMLERFYGSEEYKQYKQDDVKVKKYEEDKKKERAEESGEEYRPHKLNAEDIYKAHATPKDDFEDLKLKQLYTKLNGFKTSYDLLVDTAPSQSDVYYNTNKAAIDAIDEIALDKQEISELKKGFLDDGKDAYNAEDMKQIRELRKKILAVLEKANKVVVASQKAKAEK
jgi:site-specific DNA-cytosine methylase|nr:MAG TPA: Type I restriction enzyme [Caudoviricetes sp.]